LTTFAKWAGHAVKRAGWKLEPRAALGILALVAGLMLLAFFYLALSSQTAVLGRRVQKMEVERTELVIDNAHLYDQIVRAASATELMHRALAAGYVTSGSVRFVPIVPREPPAFEQSRVVP
jgi:hypothetical protein